MAILLLDGFETYTGNPETAGQWTTRTGNSGSRSTTNSLTGTANWSFSTGFNTERGLEWTVPAADRSATMAVGAGIRINDKGIDGVNSSLLSFETSNSALRVRHNNSDQSVSLLVGTTAVSTSDPGVIVYPASWNYVELEGTIDGSSGYAKIWVNGVNVVDYTGDTLSGSSATITNVCILSGTNIGDEVNYQIDDIYITNDAGSAPGNGRLGEIKIYPIAPNSDSAVEFNRSTGSNNYALVDELGHNSDTDYVYSDVDNDEDLYGFSAVGAATGNVVGVHLMAVARKDNTDVKSFCFVAESNASVDVSDDITLTQTYVHHHRYFEVDPDTDTTWTIAGVDAATFGVRVRP